MEIINTISEYFTPQELADYSHMSLKFIEKHIATGRLPGAVKMGRVWRFKRVDVEKQLLTGQLLFNEK